MKKILVGLILMASFAVNAQGLAVVYEAKNVVLSGTEGAKYGTYEVPLSFRLLPGDYIIATDVTAATIPSVTYAPIQSLGMYNYSDVSQLRFRLDNIYQAAIAPRVNILVLRTTP